MKPPALPGAGVLKSLEFELAYLSLLTRNGLKPLSRWEKPFNSATEECLRRLGLKTRVIERSVQTGELVRELLLSTSDQHMEAYAAKFAGSGIGYDPETVRLEGRLFGYPPCCADSYVVRGYARNSLRRRDQRILFHWACPGCAVTPQLLPEYWRIYQMCRVVRRGAAWRVIPDLVERLSVPRLRPGLATVVSLAALGVLPVTTLQVAADPLDPHVTAFTLYDDVDNDYLLASEERILGFDPTISDENTNGVPDGVDLALQLSSAVDALPSEPLTSTAYVTHNLAFGLENCAVCGASVNMGFMEIRHPLENQSLQIPYVAKHFLEHGSFSYSGSLHSGRISPPLLQFILKTDGRGHLVPEPAGTDADKDGLRDWEEPAFGTDPEKPDSDGDQLIDGIDTARELRRALETLPAVDRREDGPTDRPFVLKLMMNGVETCPRCGEVQTMGLWEVINPVIADSITIPTMAIHYLEHGGFGWNGGQLLGGQGRVDPRHLQGVLKGQPNRHLLAVSPDRDGDWLSDPEEASLGRDPGNPDQDINAVRDGLDLARAVACEIAGLPTTPSAVRVYRLDFPQRGLERCGVCATNVNMGYLTVCNPQAHLSVDVSYIALHYLEHDSFSFAGDVHEIGRSEIKALVEALFKPAVSIAGDEQKVSLRWFAKAGRTYRVCTAPDPHGPWTDGPVFQGEGKETVFTETRPPGVTQRFYKVAVW
ncbi:MAG TPA: hypothetical protein VJA21_18495 [Verrucomicrobiae bacterium]